MKLKQLDLSDGRSFEYALIGDGTDPIVMLHGYGDSWYSFNGMIEAAPDGVSVVSLTQRGHGNSHRPDDDYSIGAYAQDAFDVMDALGISGVPIVGHSMGTFIAQEIAMRDPAKVSHLCLIGSATTGDNAVLRSLIPETEVLTDPVPREFVHEFQAGTCANPLGPGMTLERIVDESMLLPARVWHKALMGLIDYRAADADPDLSAITCPTLIMWGDKDEIFLEHEQTKLTAKIERSKRSDYKDVGHGLHWEKPQEAMAELLGFLGR
ncbi:alpha/beta hydrolase [Cognatiyoonia sp. IB215182]|uniref:alpha/beta fold hydrolase n=1 Tax=Cognatiyoonia sp. IB215182 TaxID=3097353 RepID=UPI002A123EAA|nr:alpha/beta hydrolase [Cognatiyoonia sp. IB215182]MDX8355221.1 alpha/beta hydrolase [Cognatiyoonia sp. IB215182]